MEVEDIEREENVNNIILEMLKKCKMEAENNFLHIPIEDYEARVSYYTGISKGKLNHIQLKNTSLENETSIDIDTHIKILNCLCDFYMSKEKLTFQSLFDYSMQNCVIKTTTEFEKFKDDIRALGIDYQNVSKNAQLLMENPTFTFERYSYLKKMSIGRKQGKIIYYLGNTLINSNKGISFYNCVTENGLLCGIFTNNPSKTEFFKWVFDTLLPLIKPYSIVVLDKTLADQFNPDEITMFSSKFEMLQWLRTHNVPCNSSLHKYELYELIKNHPVEKTSCIEKILKAKGHEPLVLPTHFMGLSILEPFWKKILINNACYTEHKIKEKIRVMTRTEYKMFEDIVLNREKKLFSVDVSMETYLEDMLEDLNQKSNNNKLSSTAVSRYVSKAFIFIS